MFERKVIAVMIGLLVAAPSWADIQFMTPTASSGVASGQAVTSNTTRLQKDNLLYQARFSLSGTNDWSGDVLEFEIPASGIIASNATPSADAAGYLDGLSNAEAGNRNVFSIDAAGSGIDADADPDGLFSASVAIPSVASTATASAFISYVQGDDSLEADKTGGFMRERSSRLGDIINSAPQYSGNLNFGYHALGSGVSGDVGDQYVDYITTGSSATRDEMIYVGANDGMLHGFKVTDDGDADLEEVFAYIPLTLKDKLASLASPSYTHEYFVDGTPKIADAYDGSNWKTVLVGTTAAGGSGVFALNVTTPASFGTTDVLWEKNSVSAGFGDLGYTLAQASVAMLPDTTDSDADNHWAAIIGSGYQDPANDGVLYLVDVFTGTQLVSLAAGSNGLSTPLAIDSDGDLTADIIYAGDLDGKLWKFKYDSATPGWSVLELFDAGHPITGKPQAVAHPDGGFMVLFGTGRYFADSDKDAVAGVDTDPSPYAFYGIWDEDVASAASTSLTQQTILAEGNVILSDGSVGPEVRVTSKNSPNANTGWYFQLKNYDAGSGQVFNERVASEPVVRNGRVIFSTLIPNGVPYGGSGWLMELGLFSGSRLADVAFDINDDDEFSDQDKVKIKGDEIVAGESGGLSVVSGMKSEVGLIATPNVISAGDKELKYLSGSSGEIQTVVESNAGATFSKGRQSWQQLK